MHSVAFTRRAETQPHGVLLVLEPIGETVTHVAGDHERVLGLSGSPIGHTLRDVIGTSFSQLAEASGFRAAQEPLLIGFSRRPNLVVHDILAHERNGSILVEVEPSISHRPSAARLLARLRAGVARMRLARTPIELCEVAVGEIRAFTAFDRVTALRQFPDGVTRTVAEARATDTLPPLPPGRSLLDIVPEEAAAMRAISKAIVVPNAGYRPMELVDDGETPAPDLSECSLKGVSDAYRDYLTGVKVEAAMSISVFVQGEFWGLFSCHNATARSIPYELREACRHVVDEFAQLYERLIVATANAERARLEVARENLLATLSVSENVDQALAKSGDQLCTMLASDGAAICRGNDIALFGETAKADVCIAMARRTRARGDRQPLTVDDVDPLASLDDSRVDGRVSMLSVTLTRDDPLEILWFRNERSALHGEATVHADFPAGAERPWTDAEIATARRLRDSLERIRERQRLARLQSEIIHMSRVSAMGAMSSAIAHELNQPLTAARNYVIAARGLLPDGDQPQLERSQDALAKAAGQILRAGEIVRRLRSMVSKGGPDASACRVGDIVRDACALALLDTGPLQLEHILDLENPEDLVLVDSIQIQQVVINLIRNAVEAMETTQRRVLRITERRTGASKLAITVEDSGVGLAPEITSTLFSAFSSTKADGLGIGLSISRTILEAHGGQISASASELGGARFDVTLPLAC